VQNSNARVGSPSYGWPTTRSRAHAQPMSMIWSAGCEPVNSIPHSSRFQI
jgi:hypothetical protein